MLLLMLVDPPNVNLDNDHALNREIQEIEELTSGWSSYPYGTLDQHCQQSQRH